VIRAAAVAVAVAACAPRPAPSDASPADDAAITLERTPCFGTCPVYRLSISAAGVVRFEGKAHVQHVGVAEDTIPAGRVDSLMNELEQRGYFGFAEDYIPDSPACGQYSTDSPSVISSVSAGGRHRRIQHYHGCNDAPPELARIEARIDEVAGVSRWTGR
jgi:Domain of unknown function (DUF6438)